jgi:hypothetical protein
VLCQDAGSSERVQVPFLKDERGWHIFCLGCSDHVDDDVSENDEGESPTAAGASLTVDNSCEDDIVVEPAADVSGSAVVQQLEAADETGEYETADADAADTTAGEFVAQCTAAAAAAAESGEGEEEKKPWGLEWLERYVHKSAMFLNTLY